MPKPKLMTPWAQSDAHTLSIKSFISYECDRRGVSSEDLFKWALGEDKLNLYSSGGIRWCELVYDKFKMEPRSISWMGILRRLLDEWEISGRIIPGMRMVLVEKRKTKTYENT